MFKLVDTFPGLIHPETTTGFRLYLQISNQQILKQWSGSENGKRQRRTSQALPLHHKSKRLQLLLLQLCPLSVVVSLSRKRWNWFSWNKKPGPSEKSRSAAGTSQLITSALAGIHTLLPSWWSMSEEVHHPSQAPPTPPSLLNASSLFSKLNIVLHRSNPQTHHRLCLQGFPCSFGQGLVYAPPPSAVGRAASSRGARR